MNRAIDEAEMDRKSQRPMSGEVLALVSTRQTLSVPEAGRVLGIGRNAAYEAARRGDLPVIRLGRKMVVSARVLEQMLAPMQPLQKTPTGCKGK